VLLPFAALVVVGSFIIFKQSQKHRQANSPVGSEVGSKAGSEVAQNVAPPALAPVVSQSETKKPEAESAQGKEVTHAPETAKAQVFTPPSCWEARFGLESSRLSATQKENFGERAQKIKLSSLFEKFSSHPEHAQICVRSAGHVVAFDQDSKDRTTLIVRAGSGRIGLKSQLEVQVCSDGAKCAPCKIKKDSFEEAMLGGSDSDSQYNDSEDITQQLSPEVRRELARLESQAKPAAVDAWEIQNTKTNCGRS